MANVTATSHEIAVFFELMSLARKLPWHAMAMFKHVFRINMFGREIAMFSLAIQ